MITGLGIDIIKIKRIGDLIDRWGDKFIKRIFTTGEIVYCQKKSPSLQHYSARFSAKEAVFKMLGTGWRDMRWKDIEVINDNLGKPEIKLSGRAREIADEKGIEKIHLSLTHEDEYAVAQVIGEGGKSI